MIRRHIIFHGRVQGVGFRFRSAMLAQDLGLTGWVKNLYDGTVEMEVQGKSASISRMLHELKTDRYIVITDMECEPKPLDEHETTFRH